MTATAPMTPLEVQIMEMETAVDRARHRNDPARLIQALIELGQIYLDNGNTPKALTHYEEALALAQAEKEELQEARLWGYKGICLKRLGNTHFAQIALYKSYNMAQALQHQSLMIDALTQIGALQLEMGQPTKAISRLEQAYSIALNVGDHLRAMNLAGKIGDIFFRLESLEKAMEYYAVAWQTARRLGQPAIECAHLLNMGNVLLMNQEYDGAREQYELALNLAAELNNPAAEISALNSLLRVSLADDQLSMALLYGEQAIRLARETADSAGEIGNIHLLTTYLVEKGQARRAIPHLKRGAEIAEANEDWQWQFTMLSQLGYAWYSLEELAESLAAYEIALKRAKQLQDRAASARVYGRLSAVLAEQGQLPDAISAANQALSLGQELEDVALVGEQQMMLAFAYRDLGDPEQARAHCEQAVTAYRELGDAELLAQAEMLLETFGRS
jgi:tetratricopeptide (TPR) repeat protein